MRRHGSTAAVVLLAAWLWQLPGGLAAMPDPAPAVTTAAAQDASRAAETAPQTRGIPRHIPLPRPPDRCSYSSRAADWPPADETTACLRHAGSGPTVLLLGDSHAEQWAPALVTIAQERDWRLLSLTRAKCSPWDFLAVRPTDGPPPTVGAVCQAWKKVAYPTVIARYRPDLVLFAGRPQILDMRVDGKVIARSSPRWMPAWRRSWRWLVRVTTADGAKVGVFTLLPTLPFTVTHCLREHGLHTTRCDTPLAADRLTSGPNRFVRSIHDRYDRVWSIRATSLVCPGQVCVALVDGLITHADESHISARFSRSLAGGLADLIAAHPLLPKSRP